MIDINNYGEMDCPVCNEFHFSPLDESDIEMYDYIQCPHCGWKNDVKQTKNPDLSNKTNILSLNEYKAWFQRCIMDNPEYDFSEANYEATKHNCPVCGEYEFQDVNSFDICPQCGWVDDEVMESEPRDWEGSSSDLCLADYISRYQKLKKKKPNYRYSIDRFL